MSIGRRFPNPGLLTSSNPTWSSLELNLPDNEDFKELSNRLAEIEKRLLILNPTDLQARFPALQEAYDHYKLIEKLVNDQSTIPR